MELKRNFQINSGVIPEGTLGNTSRNSEVFPGGSLKITPIENSEEPRMNSWRNSEGIPGGIMEFMKELHSYFR